MVNPHDITRFMMKIKNTLTCFKKDNMPSELSENVNKLAVTVKIQEQEINLLFDQKLKVKYNMNNIYGLFWGDCPDAIHSEIKG